MMLAAGGVRIVCGLHVQSCTYLSGKDTKFGVRLLKAALDLNNMDGANSFSTSQTMYCIFITKTSQLLLSGDIIPVLGYKYTAYVNTACVW
jgi:hypothetical protein